MSAKCPPNMDRISVQFSCSFLSNIPKIVPDVTSVCTISSSKLWICKMAPY